MILVTLILAIVSAGLVWFSRPIYALGVYLAVFVLYPAYYFVPLGPLNLSVGRIVLIALLARLILTTPLPRRFNVTWMDVVVPVALVCATLSLFANAPARVVIEREGGTLLDTVLPYFAVRLVVRSREDLFTILKVVVYASLPLTAIGLLESLTSINVYAYAGSLEWHTDASYQRLGFYRASGSFQHPIAFGLHMAAMFFLLLSMWFYKTVSRRQIYLGLIIIVVGLCSSLSSAPLFALVAGVGFVALFYLRGLWFYLMIAVLSCVLAVELFSNRHFYHVLTRFAMSGSTAYYRIGLFEEAFGGGMDGHWLLGYGYVGLGSDQENPAFDWFHTDLLNIYIAKLARTGLLGVLPFLVLNVGYYLFLGKSLRMARTREDKWMIWCVLSALVSWNFAMMTVSPLNKNHTFLYILIGVAVAMPLIIREARVSRESDAVDTPVLPATPTVEAEVTTRLTDRFLQAGSAKRPPP